MASADSPIPSRPALMEGQRLERAVACSGEAAEAVESSWMTEPRASRDTPTKAQGQLKQGAVAQPHLHIAALGQLRQRLMRAGDDLGRFNERGGGWW